MGGELELIQTKTLAVYLCWFSFIQTPALAAGSVFSISCTEVRPPWYQCRRGLSVSPLWAGQEYFFCQVYKHLQARVGKRVFLPSVGSRVSLVTKGLGRSLSCALCRGLALGRMFDLAVT